MDMMKEFMKGYIEGYVLRAAWTKLRSQRKRRLSRRCNLKKR